jgi:hypothetical protein
MQRKKFNNVIKNIIMGVEPMVAKEGTKKHLGQRAGGESQWLTPRTSCIPIQ